MGSKTLLVLALLLTPVLLLSAEVAPKDVDKKFYENDGNRDINEVDDMKYFGGGRLPYVGWRGGYCPYGCCRWRYFGRYCMRCCYYPGEHVDAHTHVAEPRN